MNQTNITVALLSWIPVSAVLFLWKGPRLATPIALFGGFLLLPRGSCESFLPYVGPWINKQTVSGLGLLVGILVSDPRTLFQARPRLLDIPMIAFVLLPLVSFAANAFVEPWDSLGLVWTNFAAWSLPYLAGRLYYGDGDGPARLARAVVVAGLWSLPIFGFEAVMGPRYFLAKLIYGLSPHEHMVSRLGGWRPEGFQTNGIEVALWLALAATISSWSWLRGGWPSKPNLAWLPPAALIFATVAVRGVYGYLTLAIGLAAVVLTHFARSRVLMIALTIVPLVYMGTRLTGTWDGQALVKLVEFTGREGTVGYRLRAEDAYIQKVTDHNLVLGFGGRNSAIYDWWAKNHLWPDGWWIHQLRSGGVVGLSAAVLALFVFPVALALALPIDRSGRASPAAMAWGLALFLILHLIDCLHNKNDVTPTTLIGGSLVGLFSVRRTTRLVFSTAAGRPSRSALVAHWPLVVTAIVLISLEILGRFPRNSMTPPTTPRLDSPSTKPQP